MGETDCSTFVLFQDNKQCTNLKSDHKWTQWTVLVRFLHIRLKIRKKVFTLLCNILQQYSTPHQFAICNKDSRVQVTVAMDNLHMQ